MFLQQLEKMLVCITIPTRFSAIVYVCLPLCDDVMTQRRRNQNASEDVKCRRGPFLWASCFLLFPLKNCLKIPNFQTKFRSIWRKYWLFTVYSLQFTVYCLLFTVYCLLFAVYCLLFAAGWLTSEREFLQINRVIPVAPMALFIDCSLTQFWKCLDIYFFAWLRNWSLHSIFVNRSFLESESRNLRLILWYLTMSCLLIFNHKFESTLGGDKNQNRNSWTSYRLISDP